MLQITPASFFMLYNFLPQRELVNLAGVPGSLNCPHNGEPVGVRHEGGLEKCAHWEATGSLWDFGIAMLPASRVLAMSVAATRRGVDLPSGAREVLRGSWPLGVFVTDLLGSCLVGDPREDVVRLVTPPRKRAAAVGVSGLPGADPFAGFAVRHVIDVRMASVPPDGDARPAKPARRK